MVNLHPHNLHLHSLQPHKLHPPMYLRLGLTNLHILPQLLNPSPPLHPRYLLHPQYLHSLSLLQLLFPHLLDILSSPHLMSPPSLLHPLHSPRPHPSQRLSANLTGAGKGSLYFQLTHLHIHIQTQSLCSDPLL